MIYFVVVWITSFLSAQGISKKYSPNEIVTKREMDFRTHCKHIFGTFVEYHNNPTFVNNMVPRTYACIALDSSGNIQGLQKAFEIYTGKILRHRKLIEFTIPDWVVHSMNAWVRQ